MLHMRRFRVPLLVLSLILIIALFVSAFSNNVRNEEEPELPAELVSQLRKHQRGIKHSHKKPPAQRPLIPTIEEEEQENEEDESEADVANARNDYREIFSRTTRDRRPIPIFSGSNGTYNVNIIPHPMKHELYLVVAKQVQLAHDHDPISLTCEAGRVEDVLVCADEPTILPVTPSTRGLCPGDLAAHNSVFGPRDLRLSYGPAAPYVTFGSQSKHTCLGQWAQDARWLLDAFHLERYTPPHTYTQPTEIQRPTTYRDVEVNYFLFWDSKDKMYAHQQTWPQRVFSEIDIDGSVGKDLAPLAASRDKVCEAKHLPSLKPNVETIEQGTNSLAVTMCKRADSRCKPTDSNTYIMHIFHVQSNSSSHTTYEPYVMLFQRTAPFAIQAISQRPLWIHGRDALTEDSGAVRYLGNSAAIPKGQLEAYYITSMSWKTHGQKYHGYMDDPLFLGIGVEESRGAALDVIASDLFQDLAFC